MSCTGQIGAQAQAPGQHEHSAACVAALKTKAAALTELYRGGDDGVKDDLLRYTEAGYAFIGTAYEDGLRKAEADRLLTAAEENQKSMPSAQLETLTAACLAEGSKLLSDANAAERAIVKAAARSRVRRIRDK